MNVEEFDKKLNESFNRFDLSEKEFLTDILLLKPKGMVHDLSDDFLIDLYNNFVLSGRTIGFGFNNELIDNGKFLFFASQDPFDIGIDKGNGNIIMWDQEWARIHYRLAPDLDTFLEIILEIYDHGLPGWFEEKKYTNEDRKGLFSKIEKILDKEYLGYYQESYGN